MDKLQGLLDFCSKYHFLYCYGAGEYGKIVKEFLATKDFMIQGFLVSQGDSGNAWGKAVFSLEQVDISKIRVDAIVLSVNESYQREMICNIKRYYPKAAIYCICTEQIYRMKPYVTSEDMVDKIRVEAEEIKINYETDYEKKIKEILSCYDRISLRYIDMRFIGGMAASWIYYKEQRDRYKKRREFHLFYPYVWKEHEIDGKNKYLAGKFSAEGIEVITSYTIKFWQYVIENYREKIDVHPDFCLFDLMENFNLACDRGDFPKKKHYIYFTNDEILLGDKFLKKISVNRFVCLSSRDDAYRKNVMGLKSKEEDILTSYRNSNIETCNKAAAYLAGQSCMTIRMGAMVERKTKTPNIIDYACKYRTELLDLYLFSKCEFFISDPSGIQYLAMLFSKPQVMINTPVLSTKNDYSIIGSLDRDLMILQKYWSVSKKRYLTLREMLSIETNSPDYFRPESPFNTIMFYYWNGIIPIKNTEQEICDVVQEMMEKLDGSIVYELCDFEYQEKVEKIKNEFTGTGNHFFQVRMGKQFLRDNSWLLD